MGTANAVWVLPRQYSVVSRYRFPDRPHYSSGAPVITHTLLWVTAVIIIVITIIITLAYNLQQFKHLLETVLVYEAPSLQLSLIIMW